MLVQLAHLLAERATEDKRAAKYDLRNEDARRDNLQSSVLKSDLQVS